MTTEQALTLSGEPKCIGTLEENGIYNYPCGLRVSGELVDHQASWCATLVTEAHYRHHNEGHQPDGAWMLVETIRYDLPRQTVTIWIRCECSERSERKDVQEKN